MLASTASINFPFNNATLCIFSVLITGVVLGAIMRRLCALICMSVGLAGCAGSSLQHPLSSTAPVQTFERPTLNTITSVPIRYVIESALEQIKVTTHYTQDYRVLSYPGGD